MHRASDDRNYTPEEFADLLDEAKRRAVQLRREAQAAFWTGLQARLGRTWKRFMASPGAVFDRPVERSWPHGIR